MANRPTKKPAKPDPDEIEKLDLDPDSWAKFEGLVKSAAKMGPKPHGPGLKKPVAKKPPHKR